MKDIIKSLLENTYTLFIVVGIFLIVLGATGGWVSPTLSVNINENSWRIVLTIVGITILGIGLFGISKGRVNLQYLQSDQNILRAFENPGEDIKPKIQKSKLICLAGINLNRFIRNYHVAIDESLSRGGILRVVLVNPKSSAVSMAGFRSTSDTPAEKQLERINDSIDYLTKRFGKYGNFELRLIDYMLPYSVILLQPDKDQQDAYCYIRILPFRESTTTAPTIYPDSKKDVFWFAYFKNQFEKIWEASFSHLAN